jgi:hypothetical protein
MRKVIWLSVFCLFLTIGGFGQVKQISKNEYYKAYREAYDKFVNTSVRRQTSKDDYFRDGKLNGSTQDIMEVVSPDRFRFIFVEVVGGREDKNEVIKIGDNYYCRKNDGKWQNSRGDCHLSGGKGITDIVSSKYFVETVTENDKSFRFYRQYTIHKNKDFDGKESLWYWESKFRVGEDGRLLREDSEAGLEEAKEMRNRSVTIYEYNPKNVKIEVPIKP